MASGHFWVLTCNTSRASTAALLTVHERYGGQANAIRYTSDVPYTIPNKQYGTGQPSEDKD